MTTMLFTDPRFRSPSALGAFGLTYACDSVRTAQAELKTLLDQAVAAKLLDRPWLRWLGSPQGHPAAVAAQDAYYELVDQNLVIASDEACAQWTQTLQSASTSLRELLGSVGAFELGYKPPAESPYVNASDVPTWLKVGGGLLLATVSVVAVAYVFGQGAALAKVFKRAPRRTAGYRRRR